MSLTHVIICFLLMILRRWISVGSDLKFDARRDLDDVNAMCIEGRQFNVRIWRNTIKSVCCLSNTTQLGPCVVCCVLGLSLACQIWTSRNYCNHYLMIDIFFLLHSSYMGFLSAHMVVVFVNRILYFVEPTLGDLGLKVSLRYQFFFCSACFEQAALFKA